MGWRPARGTVMESSFANLSCMRSGRRVMPRVEPLVTRTAIAGPPPRHMPPCQAAGFPSGGVAR